MREPHLQIKRGPMSLVSTVQLQYKFQNFTKKLRDEALRILNKG